MNDMLPYVIQGVITLATAVGGVKIGLNGLRSTVSENNKSSMKRFDRVDQKLDSMEDVQTLNRERLARLEVKTQLTT